MKFLPYVWSNLWRRKIRTTLTLLSLVAAFLLFGFLAAVHQAVVIHEFVIDHERLGVDQHRVEPREMVGVMSAGSTAIFFR